MDKTRLEIKHIGAFSVVKTCFLLGGFSGFVLGFVQWAFLGVILSVAQNSPIQPGLLAEPEIEEALGDLMRVGGILLPLLGGLVGSVVGVVGGYLLSMAYNLGARVWGGIEYETAPVATSIRPIPVRSTDPGTTTPLPGQSTRPPAAPPDTADNDKPPGTHPSLFE